MTTPSAKPQSSPPARDAAILQTCKCVWFLAACPDLQAVFSNRAVIYDDNYVLTYLSLSLLCPLTHSLCGLVGVKEGFVHTMCMGPTSRHRPREESSKQGQLVNDLTATVIAVGYCLCTNVRTYVYCTCTHHSLCPAPALHRYGPSNAAGLNRLKKKMRDENVFYGGASVASMSLGAGAQGTSSQRLFVAGAVEKAEASKQSYLANQRERSNVKQKGGIFVSEGSDVL